MKNHHLHPVLNPLHIKPAIYFLSRLADVRHAALSELSNGKRSNINFAHIEKIADALGIDDIREIIDLSDPF